MLWEMASSYDGPSPEPASHVDDTRAEARLLPHNVTQPFNGGDSMAVRKSGNLASTGSGTDGATTSSLRN